MSRIIEFRAWDKEEKEYYYDVEHTYDFFCSGRGCYAESFGEVLNQPDRFIVEQFTGLLDRNGKEIYEGDIVSKDSLSGEYGALFVVKYGGSSDIDISGHHYCPFIRGFYLDEMCEYDKVDEDGYMEVIGNVHEDKELLGGEE